uniref:Uncharacterized protein n=1 Tax=Panagrolaimus superbus TaxID=310955 RepID=A0A914XY54_9BILA
MPGNGVTLIGGRRFLPPHLFSSTTSTPVPKDGRLPAFLDGWEVFTFFIIMLIVVPPIVICFKRRCINNQRSGYENVI